MGLHNVRSLKRLVPPRAALILIVDVTVPAEAVSVDQLSESISTFTGMEPLADTVPEGLVVDAKMGIRIVSGNCQ